jgi:imidazolonepropionase-like amidohydrolase
MLAAAGATLPAVLLKRNAMTLCFARHLGRIFAPLPALVLLVAAPLRGEDLVLHAKRLLDVRSGRLIEDAVVVVSGDHIRAAGARASVTVPAGARFIELGDRTLLPGLFDMHVHLSVGSSRHHRFTEDLFNGPVDSAFKAADNARLTLLAGFTTVRSAGDNDFIDVALKKAIEKGIAVGPRIVPAGYQISMTGGHGDNTGWPPGVFEVGPEQGIADGPEKLLRAVRYQIKHGAEVIKMMVSGGIGDIDRPLDVLQFSDEEMKTVVEEAARSHLKVMAHSHSLAGTLHAVRAGVASIEHGSQLDEEAIRLMKEHGTYLVPTPLLLADDAYADYPESMRAKLEEVKRRTRASVGAAIRAGVKIAFGTDAGTAPHGQNGRQFAMLVDLGMSPLAAIRAATLAAADLLGVADRGALEPGLLADIVAVRGNPLTDVQTLEHVDFVMKDGQVFKEP